MPKEDELILRLKNGDDDAVKEIFDMHYQPMCLYAFSIIKDEDMAKDIVEEIFINLWLKAKSLEIKTSLKKYLFRSVHNNCLNYIRDKKRKDNVVGDYVFHDKELLNPVSKEYPISNLIVKEIEEKIAKVLQSLPSQCKQIFELSRFENLTYYQIAQKLNISSSTVKTQMSRAFQKFREELKDYIPLISIILIDKM